MSSKRSTEQMASHRMSALRIVVLGDNEEGKCAAVNTILGREAVGTDCSIKSVRRRCEKHIGTVEGRKISVITIPTFSSISSSEEELKARLDQCISLSSPGPHVFLLVVRVGRFTEDTRNTVKWIQENFGEEALKFTLVLFTGSEEYLNKEAAFQKLVEKCRAEYHVFKAGEKNVQVSELLEKIDRMVQQNEGQHYTKEMYHRKVRQEEKRRRDNEGGGKAELNIRKVGKILLSLLEVILKALLVEIYAILRSALKGFGVGLIVIVILSLIGVLTHSWTSIWLKVLIFWSGGVIGVLMELYSDTTVNR